MTLNCTINGKDYNVMFNNSTVAFENESEYIKFMAEDKIVDVIKAIKGRKNYEKV